MSTNNSVDEDPLTRPSRAVARILSSYGFDPNLVENASFPIVDFIEITFSSREDEEVGTMSIIDILNEHGYRAWFRQGCRAVYIRQIAPATPGEASNQVSRM